MSYLQCKHNNEKSIQNQFSHKNQIFHNKNQINANINISAIQYQINAKISKLVVATLELCSVVTDSIVMYSIVPSDRVVCPHLSHSTNLAIRIQHHIADLHVSMHNSLMLILVEI